MSNQPLHIIYQDEYLVAIDKPAGHLVHPASTPQDDDLVAMKILRDQIGHRVHSIHRLDRPTSGVLLFGIEKDTARKLHKSLADHEFEKHYLAAVTGKPDQTHWHCNEPIQKEPAAPIREAHTVFQLLTSLDHPDAGTLSLIQATPHTGRFHQIRRHLIHHKLPIIGDYRYAGIERCDKLGSTLETGSRMLLQAHQLTITHPVTEEVMKFTAPLEPLIKKVFPNYDVNYDGV